MNKKQKIEYINNVHERFMNARNHGNTNNWWYPTPYVIAYNVKMHSFADVETLRTYTSDVQNKYYKDNTLDAILWEEQEDTCRFLVDDIQEEYGLESYFAGRLGGWLEVQYETCGLDYIAEDDAHTIETINELYKEARKLEKLESKVSEFITNAHKSYNKYVDSKEYYTDILERLESDTEIKETYKTKAHELLELAK